MIKWYLIILLYIEGVHFSAMHKNNIPGIHCQIMNLAKWSVFARKLVSIISWCFIVPLLQLLLIFYHRWALMAVEAEALQSVPRVEPVLVQIFANRGPSRAVTLCSPLAAPPPVPDLFQVAYFSRSSLLERAKASTIGGIRIVFALIKRIRGIKRIRQ